MENSSLVHAEPRYRLDGVAFHTSPPDFRAVRDARLLFLVQEFVDEVEHLREMSSEPSHTEGMLIASPADAYAFLRVMLQDLEQEQLVVLILNAKNRLLAAPTVYKGSVHTLVVRMPEVFRPAIVANAASIIVAHNHPSGDPTPGADDLALTRDLVRAGKLLDVPVNDHLVIGRNGFVSIGEMGLKG